MKTKKEKKRLFIISVLIIALLASLVNSVTDKWTKIVENTSEISVLSESYEKLLEDEIKLANEVEKLHDSDYVARYAKEKYMYSKEGETIIRIN